MLNHISGHVPNDSASRPLEMLQACHSRIRHFLHLARTLAEAGARPHEQIAEAAEAIYRYFRYAMPLHEADENETLFPRFRDGKPVPEALREAARAMVEQHHAIDELIGELLRVCDMLRRQPEQLPTLDQRLRDVAIALERVFAAHLEMEEKVIFPALALFPPAQLEEMVREMQERRRPPEIPIQSR